MIMMMTESHSLDFGTNWKPVNDFLLVNTTNFYISPFLCYRFWQGMPLFNSFIRAELLNSELQNLASKTENVTVSRGAQEILIHWTI